MFIKVAIDQESRQAATYNNDSKLDMIITVMDEGAAGITRKGSKTDDAKAIEEQKRYSSGYFNKAVVEKDEETGKMKTVLRTTMNRKITLAGSNYRPQSDAIQSRVLLIMMKKPPKGQSSGAATNGAIFNLPDVERQRAPFLMAMNTLTSCAGIIYGLNACGAFNFNYSNGAIIRILNHRLKQGLETGARIGTYIDKIAESIHVLELATRWWRHSESLCARLFFGSTDAHACTCLPAEAGEKVGYKMRHLVLFLRMNNVVPIEAYSVAASMVNRATHVVKELYAVASAIKMCVQTPSDGDDSSNVRFQKNSNGSHFMLSVTMVKLKERIMPFLANEGEGAVEAVLDDLKTRSVDGSVMMLETCSDDPTARFPVAMVHPSLFDTTGALTNAERTMLGVLHAVINDPSPRTPRWWPLYEDNAEDNDYESPKRYVFKPSVANALLDPPNPIPAPDIFYPKELQTLGPREHAAACAFLDYRNQANGGLHDSWYCSQMVKIGVYEPAPDGEPGNSGTFGMNVGIFFPGPRCWPPW